MRKMTREDLNHYRDYLRDEERAPATVEKYMRDIASFALWLGDVAVDKAQVAAWKERLIMQGCAPVTINAKLSALNGFFVFKDWNDCRVKFLRVQRRVFRSKDKELTHQEYMKLLRAAQQSGKEQLALVMETICATGIRVSELHAITVDTLRRGTAVIALKGKIRTILLPGKLCRKLLQYTKRKGIVRGEVFLSAHGKGLTRRQIWGQMKCLCCLTRVEASKVFPHNLRHLFARTFYNAYRDIVQLADVLGHASIETTRIYLISTGEEHAKRIERLRLVN